MVLENTGELRQKAKELRQAKDFKGAKARYADLWKVSHDVWDGTGLLHCLRKLGEFDEAIPLADELLLICGGNDWCRNEIIWTFISGVLSKLEEDEPLDKTLEVAERLMALGPEGTALELTVFEVLKRAKQKGDWKVVNEWVVRLSPENISPDPLQFDNGREGWSRKAQWYNYRINSLIEAGRCDDAIEIIEGILPEFPREKKFFARLKAVACHRLGRLDEAREIYDGLCGGPRPDWWILHDYAKLLKDANEPKEALKLMYKAASSNRKLEPMVNLFEEIGALAAELNLPQESMPHSYLAKFIREQNGWKLSESLFSRLENFSKGTTNTQPPVDLKQALAQCKDIWNQYSPNSKISKKAAKKDLQGTVSIGNQDRPFCFIRVDGRENYFCFKSELPAGAKDGEVVLFDIVPSYDKKKQKDSWKATNVRRSHDAE